MLEQHGFELQRSTYTGIFFNKYIQYYSITGWLNPQMQNHRYRGLYYTWSIHQFRYPRQFLETTAYRHPRTTVWAETETMTKRMQSTNKKLRLSSLVVQWVKDPMLSLQELGLLLGFDPWPGNLHMQWMQKKKRSFPWDLERISGTCKFCSPLHPGVTSHCAYQHYLHCSTHWQYCLRRTESTGINV